FFGTALATLGVLSFTRLFRQEVAWAADKKSAGGKGIKATDESLKGLAAASGVTDANFWKESDVVATVQNFCDGSIKGNPKCGPAHKPGQFCGGCTFLQERASYQGNVVGKCQLIQPKPPKTHVWGHFACASYVPNAANKYDIKA